MTTWMLSMRTPALALLLAVFPAACATTGPTPQLLRARQAYAHVQASDAPTLTPKEVREAELLLDQAERTHRRHPGSAMEVHLAYLATRQAEVALADAQREQAQRASIANQQKFAALRERAARLTEQQMKGVASELKDLRAQIAAAMADHKLGAEVEALKEREQALTRRQAVLEHQIEGFTRPRRRTAERLRGIAEVGEYGRQVVISLSEPGLFEPGRSELLSSGQNRLRQVAELLKRHDTGPILIVGSTAADQPTSLARERAQAVRDFLVSNGLPKDRVQAFGPEEAKIPAVRNRTAAINIVMAKPKGGTL